ERRFLAVAGRLVKLLCARRDDSSAPEASMRHSRLRRTSPGRRPRYCQIAMGGLPFDAQERLALCDLFAEIGADVPTLLGDWTARALAAHLVLREHDLIAGPCLVLPGPFERFAERRRGRLADHREFRWLVERIRAGPPPGFFRIGWVRSFPNL